ncbi:MAG: hypothetical protein VX278_05030 [Myxococcota bacterium]|nr:hypothetical protein [Myxococcota bacterium]
MNEPTVAVAENDEHPDVDTLIFRQVQQLSNAIRQLLIRLEDQFGIEIPSIKICGGGAEICGIEQFLSEEMGVPVEKSLLPMETSNNPSPQRFTLAYWIGQCATGNSHGRELNLRTGDFSYQGNLEKLGSLLRIMGIAAAAILILGFAWFGYNYMTLRRELNTLNSDALAIFTESLPEFPVPEDSETALTLVNAEVLEKTEQIQSLQKLFPKEPPVLSKIQAFSSHLPSHTQARIDVTEMTISKTSINVRAETDQFEQATLIVQELQKYALFSEAQKADEKNAAKGIRFNIVIPLNAQQEE